MFDVRPIIKSADFDLSQIQELPKTVVLRNLKDVSKEVSIKIDEDGIKEDLQVGKISYKNELMSEMEEVMAQTVNLSTELSGTGAKIIKSSVNKIQPKKQGFISITKSDISSENFVPPKNLPVVSEEVIDESIELHRLPTLEESIDENDKENEFEDKKETKNIRHDREDVIDSFMVRKVGISPSSKEVDFLIQEQRDNKFKLITSKEKRKKPIFTSIREKIGKKYLIGLSVIIAFIFFQGLIGMKDDFIYDGNQAVINLESARASLNDLDFQSAARDFAQASKDFNKISKKMNLMGASMISMFSNIPGLNKVKSAKDIINIGEDMSLAGEILSRAFSDLSKTNFVSYFGDSQRPQKSLSNYVNNFRNSLIDAKEKIDRSQIVLASIDTSILPEDKQEIFVDFRDKVPQLQKFIGGAINYSDFLLEVVGTYGPRKYLVLFQNNSELRPTGGFPGTYGLIEFNQGFLDKIFVDDIYNPDGQIKENIIPPKELQHITPTWGMRDANWFANFPDSAEKVMEMYEKDGGASVDGVLTFTPTIVTRILNIIGPIDMPEYNVTLNSENFLPLVQSEVEYGDNNEINQPKKIVIDFTPKFIEKLAAQNSQQWLKIFQILMDGMIEKHILAYFNDEDMQKVVEDNNFAGLVKEYDGFFLLVTHSNIKGSKTDAVIDNSIKVETRITTGEFIEHTLTITRTHHGGRTDYGFYNRQNPDYIRVMVPTGSELLDINGNSKVSPDPIVDYNQNGFVTDSDLVNYENGMVESRGVKIFTESGKTVFGFWMLTNPGKTKTITLKYMTPISVKDKEYSILVQKQPGTIKDNFRFEFNPPNNSQVTYGYPRELNPVGSNLVLDDDLLTDQVIGIRWK